MEISLTIADGILVAGWLIALLTMIRYSVRLVRGSTDGEITTENLPVASWIVLLVCCVIWVGLSTFIFVVAGGFVTLDPTPKAFGFAVGIITLIAAMLALAVLRMGKFTYYPMAALTTALTVTLLWAIAPSAIFIFWPHQERLTYEKDHFNGRSYLVSDGADSRRVVAWCMRATRAGCALYESRDAWSADLRAGDDGSVACAEGYGSDGFGQSMTEIKIRPDAADDCT